MAIVEAFGAVEQNDIRTILESVLANAGKNQALAAFLDELGSYRSPRMVSASARRAVFESRVMGLPLEQLSQEYTASHPEVNRGIRELIGFVGRNFGLKGKVEQLSHIKANPNIPRGYICGHIRAASYEEDAQGWPRDREVDTYIFLNGNNEPTVFSLASIADPKVVGLGYHLYLTSGFAPDELYPRNYALDIIVPTGEQ